MKIQAVLSALGRDRVGVADDLATALAHRKIGIERSRMTALGGHFALLVELWAEREDLTRLRRDLVAVGRDLGFHLQLDRVSPALPSREGRLYLIESYSAGPVGLSAVTQLLKRHQINIEELQTEASAASFTSKITFHMKARITIPSSCPVASLERELHDLERERDLDVELEPAASLVSEPLAPTPAI